MLCFPNAKINLGLNIVGKRPDGYHDIETVFCPAGLTDILEFVPDPGMPPGTCTFNASGIILDGTPEDNVSVRAYRLLSRDFDLPAIRIHLHKMIPPGSGLGGGSSDAAFMLRGLDREFGLGLEDARLMSYAGELGSDCAFFLVNKPVFGYGRGDRFRDLPRFPGGLHVILVHPGIHISTASAYAGVKPHVPSRSLEQLIGQPVSGWKDTITNDFEQAVVARHPAIGKIREKLYRLGAVYASMSGSGSCVYGLFRKAPQPAGDNFPGYFTWTGKL